MAKPRNDITNKGIGKLQSDDRGGLSIMRTPFSRMPLANDVAVGEAPNSPKSRDPLGYFPEGTGVGDK